MTGGPGIERAAAVLGPRGRRGVPLGPLTTYRVGGPAALFVEAADLDDLAAVAEAARSAPDLALLVVGRGSNLLVADAGFPGLAVALGPGFDWVDIPADPAPAGTAVTVRAGGATSLPVLARRTAGAGLRGFEWAVGVPGSVGGGVRMNAGGHGSDMAAVLARAWVVPLRGERGEPGRAVEVAPADLDLGYRRSSVGAAEVVVAAALDLVAGDRDGAQEEIAAVVRWRREHQPGGSNAGSVFANPAGAPAGQLIDEAGLKGARHGSAAVSDKHANFIQVDDGGSADDVRALMDVIQQRVAATAGVDLLPEVRLVGFEDGL